MLFDSAILIDFLNEIPGAPVAIRSDDNRAISVVTWIEVLAGARTSESERSARELLSIFKMLPLSTEVTEEAVVIRRTSRLKLPDAIILATARAHGLVLITRNTRDFAEDEPGIRIPYRL